MANHEQQHKSVSTVLYAWPPTALDEEQQPSIRVRLALHAHAAHPTLPMEALRQASLRAKLVAAKDVYAADGEDAGLPWLIVYVGGSAAGGGGITLDVSPAAGAPESSCDAVRGVLDASGFAAVARALRRALPPSKRLDAFVVFYAPEGEEEGKWLRAESPSDVGNVIQDAVRSADVAYLREASFADATPEVAAFLEALGAAAAPAASRLLSSATPE